jgi:hypothetical protein
MGDYGASTDRLNSKRTSNHNKSKDNSMVRFLLLPENEALSIMKEGNKGNNSHAIFDRLYEEHKVKEM